MNSEWTKEWQEGNIELNNDEGREAVDWMRTRPDSVKAIMRKFPPSCLVKSVQGYEHRIPAPGTIGLVASYLEPSSDSPNGELTVRQHPDADIRAACDPDKMEVVGYYKGLTPEIVEALLSTTTLN